MFDSDIQTKGAYNSMDPLAGPTMRLSLGVASGPSIETTTNSAIGLSLGFMRGHAIMSFTSAYNELCDILDRIDQEKNHTYSMQYIDRLKRETVGHLNLETISSDKMDELIDHYCPDNFTEVQFPTVPISPPAWFELYKEISCNESTIIERLKMLADMFESLFGSSYVPENKMRSLKFKLKNIFASGNNYRYLRDKVNFYVNIFLDNIEENEWDPQERHEFVLPWPDGKRFVRYVSLRDIVYTILYIRRITSDIKRAVISHFNEKLET